MEEETTVVAEYVQEFGNSWYVDEILLQKSFKSGMWNPKTGDSINLKLDSEGRVVGWKKNKRRSSIDGLFLFGQRADHREVSTVNV